MSIKEQIKEEILHIRANYQGLERILPYDLLTEGRVSVHPKSEGVLSLLEKVLNGSKKVEALLRKWVLQEQKAMLLLPDDDKRYLENVVRPRYSNVRKLFIQYHPDGWWEEFLGESDATELESDSTEIAHTLMASLIFYDDTVVEDDDRRNNVFDFVGAEEVVRSPYFTPDQWHLNANALRPVIQKEHDALIPIDVRRRLEATYASFVFGNWFACVAVGRSALEYALRSRAETFGIVSDHSKPLERDENLDSLIQRITDRAMPELFDPMDRVRKRGNAVMHPSRSRPQADPDRRMALGIVRDLRDCVERLYANPDTGVEKA